MVSKKNHPKSNSFRKYGYFFLVVAFILLVSSLVINFIFIDEEFKQEYRQLQFDECIEKGTKADVCESNFGEQE